MPKQIGRWKHLTESFPKTCRSVLALALAPSWLVVEQSGLEKRPRGVIDTVLYGGELESKSIRKSDAIIYDIIFIARRHPCHGCPGRVFIAKKGICSAFDLGVRVVLAFGEELVRGS